MKKYYVKIRREVMQSKIVVFEADNAEKALELANIVCVNTDEYESGWADDEVISTYAGEIKE